MNWATHLNRAVIGHVPSVSPGSHTLAPALWKRLALCMAPGLIFLLGFLVRSRGSTYGRFTLFDDAMISMAYARTLAETGEWVWFPGADRVQGFTNPLWTLWMSLLHLLGLESSMASLAVSVSSLLLLVATAVTTAIVIRVCLPLGTLCDWAAAIGGGTTLFVYPLVFWSLRGMEVGLLALLTTLMAGGLIWLQHRWARAESQRGPLLLLATSSCLGVLTRMDFLVVTLVVVCLAAWWAPHSAERREVLLVLALPLVLLLAVVLIFQHVYFGDFLTNTYRLKVEGFSAGVRLERGVITAAKNLPIVVLILLGLVVTLTARTDRTTRRSCISLATIVLGTFAYSIWVGGDAWEWTAMANRYFSVVLPLAVAVVFIALIHLLIRQHVKRSTLGLGFAAFVLSGAGFALVANPFRILDRPALMMGALLAAGSALMYLAVVRFWVVPSLGRGVWALLTGAILVIWSTSAVAGLLWIGNGGAYVQDDARFTNQMLGLREVTLPSAVVATVVAGASGYYLERPMVDLLGKSDDFVASGQPVRSADGSTRGFYPGHNKWDYEYSIGELRPDVVVDLYLPTEEDLSDLVKWGYVKQCPVGSLTGYFFLAESPRVMWDRLQACE